MGLKMATKQHTFFLFILYSSFASGFFKFESWKSHCLLRRRSQSALNMSRKGKGMMSDKSYSWSETREELEVRMKVPKETKASEICCSLTSSKVEIKHGDRVLIKGPFRLKVNVDGCYWNFDDPVEEGDQKLHIESAQKDVVLKLEKKFKVFDMEEEWHGVLADIREENATKEYHFDERDKFDMKKYFEYMGGYNESLVNKTLFSNISDSFNEDLVKRGYVKEMPDPLKDWHKSNTAKKAAAETARQKLVNITSQVARNSTRQFNPIDVSGDPSLFKDFSAEKGRKAKKKDHDDTPKFEKEFKDMNVDELFDALKKLNIQKPGTKKDVEAKIKEFRSKSKK